MENPTFKKFLKSFLRKFKKLILNENRKQILKENLDDIYNEVQKINLDNTICDIQIRQTEENS